MTKTTRIVCLCILGAGIFFLLSNNMVRVGKSLPTSKAFSIVTLLPKLDCMQSFSECSARGLLER